MTKLLAVVAAVALALAALSGGATAAIKPPKPPKPAKPAKPAKPPKADDAAVPATLTLDGQRLVLHAVGLTPGTYYDFTYELWEAGESTPYWLGGTTGVAVLADGTFTVGFLELADLYEAAHSTDLTKVVAWLRPPHSTVHVVATNAEGEPILATYLFE